jgi:hypothetical protein
MLTLILLSVLAGIVGGTLVGLPLATIRHLRRRRRKLLAATSGCSPQL